MFATFLTARLATVLPACFAVDHATCLATFLTTILPACLAILTTRLAILTTRLPVLATVLTIVLTVPSGAAAAILPRLGSSAKQTGKESSDSTGGGRSRSCSIRNRLTAGGASRGSCRSRSGSRSNIRSRRSSRRKTGHLF